jgi:CubicO group peptidase (beta-lactamase class C family)
MKHKKSILLILIAVFFSLVVEGQANNTNKILNVDSFRLKVSREVNSVIKNKSIPSISIALIKEDSIFLADAFGYVNVKKKVVATKSTIYNAGSTFKFATATAIMQLVEKGALNIDSPANNYLGVLAIKDSLNRAKNVTIRHLLSHHSGLKGPIETVSIWERKLPKSLEDIVSQIDVEETPGTDFKYCNHCYAVLGLVIERVSGQSYQNYIIEHILTPLGITDKTLVTPTPEMVEEMALPYTLENNVAIPVQQKRFDVFPAGDVYLTPSEMAKFLIAHLNEGKYNDSSILMPETAKKMYAPQFGKQDYGLGVGVKKTETETFLNHAGGVPGFSSFFRVGLNSKTGVYITSNTQRVHQTLTAIANYSLKLLNGEANPEPLPSFITKDFKEIMLPDSVLQKYVGKFQLKPDYFITITLENSKLFAQATGNNKFEITPHQIDRFFVKNAFLAIDFNIENGKATSFSLFDVASKRVASKVG